MKPTLLGMGDTAAPQHVMICEALGGPHLETSPPLTTGIFSLAFGAYPSSLSRALLKCKCSRLGLTRVADNPGETTRVEGAGLASLEQEVPVVAGRRGRRWEWP